jgi:hypothetical protein
MIKSFFSIFFFSIFSFSVYAQPSETFEKHLADRIHQVMKPVADEKTKSFPGVEVDFSYWHIDLVDLRKEGLRILEKKYQSILENPRYFPVQKSFIAKTKSFFSKICKGREKNRLNTPLFFRMPLLYWENKQFDQAFYALRWLESAEKKDSEHFLSDCWLHLSFCFLQNKQPPDSLLSQMKQLTADPWKSNEIRNKITKISSFYGLNCDVQQMKISFEYVVQCLKNLLNQEPKIVFLMRRDRSFFQFPDIVKQIMMKMKRPSFWLKNKVEQAFFLLSDLGEYHSLFAENMLSKVIQSPFLPSFFMAIKEKADCLQLLPYEQALSSQIAMLEKKITPDILKEIAETGAVKVIPDSLKYSDFLDLAFLYKNSEEIRLREAFELVSFVQNKFFQTDLRVSLYLAAMHQSGSGTSENRDQAKSYFLEALYGLSKSDGVQDVLKRNLSVLSAFAYWFDVEMPYDPEKEDISPQYAFQIFEALLAKGPSVENAFLQAYVNDSDYYLWDLLQKAFQDQNQK